MFKDRAIETIDAAFTGTGTYNLGGAATNSQALDSAFGSGTTLFYLVRNASWSKFEIGYGVVTSGSPDTLTRNVKRSYNGSAFGTSAVDWQVGDHPLYVYSAPVGEELALMRRTHRGSSAPTPAEAGLLWEDTTGAPTGVLLKIYDGADWITIGTIDETANTFTAAGGPYLPSAGGTLTGDVTLGTNAQILLDDSITAAGANLPLAFDGDTDLGMYRKSANTGALAANSADVLSWGTSGVDITGGLTTTGSINTINGLSGFILQKDGSNNPLIAFDSTDYLGYDRTGNQHLAVIGSTEASATTLARGVLAKNTPSMAVSVADVAGTPTVQRSVNVSSITDNGVGDFTINLTTAINSAETALLCGNMRYSALNSGIPVVTGRNIDRTQTSTAIQVATWSGGSNDARDASRWAVATIDGA